MLKTPLSFKLNLSSCRLKFSRDIHFDEVWLGCIHERYTCLNYKEEVKHEVVQNMKLFILLYYFPATLSGINIMFFF